MNSIRKPRFATMLALFSVLLMVSSCSVGEASSVSTTPSASAAVFGLDRTYQYHVVIGHSKTTSGTNDDVSVTLVSLDTSTSTGASRLQIAFFDSDTQLSAHFLFKELTNVYMVDNNGARYQAISAKPDDIVINARQGGNVIFTFPLLHADVGSLAIYVNTDRSALETHCTMLKPNETSSVCGA
jgi:hypothetical protein